MSLPEFILSMPALKLPFSDDQVTTNAIASDDGLGVFFSFHEDFILPPHSHKGQWGTVIKGSVELTISGETRTYFPGESYSIPSGAVHSAKVPAGSILFDVFEEPDRYPLRRKNAS